MPDLLIDRTAHITAITLNRPDVLNAFDLRLANALRDAIGDASSDEECRVIVLTGAGRAFCAGADVGCLKELVETRDRAKAAELVSSAAAAVAAMAAAPKPVIAAVNGPAAGGGANLALACDLRIASQRASIGQVFNRIGLQPDLGGTYFLPRLVGLGKALELTLTAEMIDADEAHRIGLFNRVVAPEALMRETQALAEQLAAKPSRALAMTKQAIRRGAGATLDEMLAVELENQLALFASDDALEGIRAFAEKRQPRFRGV